MQACLRRFADGVLWLTDTLQFGNALPKNIVGYKVVPLVDYAALRTSPCALMELQAFILIPFGTSAAPCLSLEETSVGGIEPLKDFLGGWGMQQSS